MKTLRRSAAALAALAATFMLTAGAAQTQAQSRTLIHTRTQTQTQTPASLEQPPAPAGPNTTQPASASSGSAAQRPTPEEALWQRIESLRVTPASAQTHEARFSQAIEHRRRLLERLRNYLALYPGGAHSAEAVQLELATRFEMASLSGGDYRPFCQRVREYLEQPPSPSALHEAAYWEMHCRRMERVAAAAQPASAPAVPSSAPAPTVSQAEAIPGGGMDPQMLAEYREYVRRYPSSRHVPRLTALLFEDAGQRGDRAAQRVLLSRLRETFPDHLTTRQLAAELRRAEAVGQPFALRFLPAGAPESENIGKNLAEDSAEKSAEESTKEDAAKESACPGAAVDVAQFAGRPVAIVVWAAFDVESRRRIRQIEELRRVQRELCVLGVNLDESAEEMRAAAQAAQIGWPQFFDGRGWAHEFAHAWGLRTLPWVFVLDRQGRLLGATDGGQWREWLERAITGSPGK